MIYAPTLLNESERLESLYTYDVLDSVSKEEYDNLTQLASTICDVPIAMITFMAEDTQYIKSSHGISIETAPRNVSFCGHAMMKPKEIMVVNNALEDIRFADNPYVIGDTHVRFYAGAPILDPNDLPLGTLCLFDQEAHDLTASQLKSMQILTRQVEKLLELRVTTRQLEETNKLLAQHNENLSDFTYMISHDLKAPTRRISTYADIIIEDYSDTLEGQTLDIVSKIKESANEATEFIKGLIEYSRASFVLEAEMSSISTQILISSVLSRVKIPDGCKVQTDIRCEAIYTHQLAIEQILTNLISNAAKYGKMDNGNIWISIAENEKSYILEIKDDGIGISEDKLASIFKIFYRVDASSSTDDSTGVGLAIVQKLVKYLDGEISLSSQRGHGSSFVIHLPKKVAAPPTRKEKT